MEKHFLFYDYETSGVHHNFDQVYQFAGVKTDANLNIIQGSEHNLLCKPRPDVIPHPRAFLTHKLDIRALETKGVSEFELAGTIQEIMMAQPGTIISGYNTMAFDDMMTRNMMYRNMRSPYDHEFKNDNQRFDIMKLVTMMYALRPDTLSWKINELGEESFKLSDLSEANGLLHESAHDALSDVYATINLAKLIMERNGRAFSYLLNFANKHNAMELLSKREPLLHVSNFYGKQKKCTSMVLPLIMDIENKNKILCVDLRHDLTDVLSMSSDEIRKYLFTSKKELPEGSPIVPLLGIESNKLPIIVEPKKMLNHQVATRCQIDVDRCYQNAELIRNNSDLTRRIQEAFVGSIPHHANSYAQIYTGGFLSRDDSNLRASMTFRDASANNANFKIETADIHQVAARAQDTERQFNLMLRAKWNNFSDKILSSNSFSAVELKKWSDYIIDRLKNEENDCGLTVDGYMKEVERIRIEEILSDEDNELIDYVTQYILEQVKKASIIASIANSNEMSDVANIEVKSNPAIRNLEAKINLFNQRQPHQRDEEVAISR
ncbi:Exodeoxyribonuclease I [compost metagenome]